jgi:hypothetical protein
MQRRSFEEFIRQQTEENANDHEGSLEPFMIERCPVPGCNCGQVHPSWEKGLITGFRCDHGCVFSVRRNAFTGDITYYKLEEFDVTRIPKARDVKGMKFNALGEPYTDWY